MNVSSLSSALIGLQSARTNASVQYAVAAKMLDTSRDQGAAVVELLKAAEAGMEEAVADMANAIGAQLDTFA